MIKLNFLEDGVQVVILTGAGPASAKLEYGEGFPALKAIPEQERARLGKLLGLAIQHLKLQDAHAAAKAAKEELDAINGPQLLVPYKKIVVAE